MKKQRKLFCERGKLCYNISVLKECEKRRIKDIINKNKIARKKSNKSFEYIWKGEAKVLLRKLHGVDMRFTKK